MACYSLSSVGNHLKIFDVLTQQVERLVEKMQKLQQVVSDYRATISELSTSQVRQSHTDPPNALPQGNVAWSGAFHQAMHPLFLQLPALIEKLDEQISRLEQV